MICAYRKRYFVEKAFRPAATAAASDQAPANPMNQDPFAMVGTFQRDREHAAGVACLFFPSDPTTAAQAQCVRWAGHTGMMKQNMAMVVPNMALMAWVSYFFSGFVLVRLPFRVGENLKPMLQRGIMLK